MLLIKLPGTLADTTGLPKVITTNSGFPNQGLTDLFLFEEGGGTRPANAVSGSAAGQIEAPYPVNNSFSWLDGGGLRLEGSQVMSAPSSDASGPWTIISGSAVVGSVGGGGEKISGLLGFREYATVPPRGVSMYVRGGEDWNSGTPNPYYAGRAMSNGVQSGVNVLQPNSGLGVIGPKRLHILQYDGQGQASARVVSANGLAISEVNWSVSSNDFLSASGNLSKKISPCLGLSGAVFSGGAQECEVFARYSRVLSNTELDVFLSSAKALGAKRGRAWS